MLKRWLQQFENDQTERGELVRLLLNDELLQYYHWDGNTVEVHLRRLGSPDETIALFKRMFDEYRS